MAKKQTFADKATKQKNVATCPVCEDALVPTLMLQPAPSKSGSYRMREMRVAVCKCNKKEVYG